MKRDRRTAEITVTIGFDELKKRLHKEYVQGKADGFQQGLKKAIEMVSQMNKEREQHTHVFHAIQYINGDTKLLGDYQTEGAAYECVYNTARRKDLTVDGNFGVIKKKLRPA